MQRRKETTVMTKPIILEIHNNNRSRSYPINQPEKSKKIRSALPSHPNQTVPANNAQNPQAIMREASPTLQCETRIKTSPDAKSQRQQKYWVVQS